jgi:hypothetical protein
MILLLGLVEGRRVQWQDGVAAFNLGPMYQAESRMPSRSQTNMQEPAGKKKAQSKGLDQSALIDQGIDRLADMVKKNAGKRSDPSQISMLMGSTSFGDYMNRKAIASRTAEVSMDLKDDVAGLGEELTADAPDLDVPDVTSMGWMDIAKASRFPIPPALKALGWSPETIGEWLKGNGESYGEEEKEVALAQAFKDYTRKAQAAKAPASRTSKIVMEDEPEPKAKAKAKPKAKVQMSAEEYGAEQVKWFNDKFGKAEIKPQVEPDVDTTGMDDPWAKRKVQPLYDTGNLR